MILIFIIIILLSLFSVYRKEHYKKKRNRQHTSPRNRRYYINRHISYPKNDNWGVSIWRYIYPYNNYPYYYIPINPGCDGKSCGGYCNPFNSRCCGGSSPSTCGMSYCKGSSLCN